MHSYLHVAELGLDPGPFLVAGNVLWVIAYLFIIRAGFRDRSYGVPLFSICLNITWELFFFLNCPLVPDCDPAKEARCLCPPLGTDGKLIITAWLVLDVTILFQLFRFGRPFQFIPEIRKYFHPVVVGTLLFAFAWHYSYITFYRDRSGIEDAWGINLVMSGLFILMLFLRPGRAGLSLGAAVAKMLGSALNAVGLLVMVPFPFPDHKNPTMMYLLFATVFVLDVAYIWLLAGGRPVPSAGSAGAASVVA